MTLVFFAHHSFFFLTQENLRAISSKTTSRVSVEVVKGGEAVLKEPSKSLCFQKFPPLIGSHNRCFPLCITEVETSPVQTRPTLAGCPRARSAAR